MSAVLAGFFDKLTLFMMSSMFAIVLNALIVDRAWICRILPSELSGHLLRADDGDESGVSPGVCSLLLGVRDLSGKPKPGVYLLGKNILPSECELTNVFK